MPQLQVPQTVNYEQIEDVLETAWEQCGYWAYVEQIQSPPTWEYKSHWDGKRRTSLIALNPGGWVRFEDRLDGNKQHTLDLEAIKKGLQIMANLYPWHFKDLITDNHDAITADVFLQCCLLGEIVYG
jgi:hypothetical protein